MKRRTRKKPDQNKVFIQDWMAFRPYDNQSDYDLHYLKIANEIHRIIFRKKELSFVPNLPEPEMLACIITSYYEDYVCEIGIWKAFTSYNKELYGYHLPFFESEDYDPDYINPEDISYLLWHFFSKWNNTFFAPDFPMFSVLGQKIYSYLEPLLDDALATEFYEGFFTVRGDEDFFDVKERLKWFAEGSYLFAADLYFDRKEKLVQAIENDDPGFWADDPGKYLYMIMEEYIYRRRCSFSALTAPEFFARVCRCTEPVRQDIAGLKERHFSTFLCKSSEERHFIFESIQTGREYRVRKDSIQQSRSLNIEDSIGFIALVPWQGQWWMTGAAGFFDRTEKIIRSLRKEMINSPFLRTEEQLQKAKDAVENQYQVFVEYFGAPLVAFATRRAANEEMRRYLKTVREKALEKFPDARENASPPLEGDFIGDVVETGGIGIFYNRQEGMTIFGGINNTIKYLEQEEPLGQEEVGELFEAMTNYNPAVVEYLLGNYPTHNIRVPITGCKTDLLKHIWFVNRFEHPDDFGEIFPRITLIIREDLEE
ncbi:MAG: DUF3843 family protein [Lewinellaceae bacterium]|nr:DUF3843 family protein [Lewinellaceae bacterium]